jgi:hypothetical protein
VREISTSPIGNVSVSPSATVADVIPSQARRLPPVKASKIPIAVTVPKEPPEAVKLSAAVLVIAPPEEASKAVN